MRKGAYMGKQKEKSQEEAYLCMVEALRKNRPATEKVRLFKDSGRYKGDVFASVNGRRFLIQRGVEVELPYAVAQVIRASERQDEAAARFAGRCREEARFA